METEIEKKFEEIMDLAQAVQDAVMELGFLIKQRTPREEESSL